MLKNAQVAATLPVSDLDRARKFYEETLGLGEPEVRADGVRFTLGNGSRLLIYPSQFAGTNQGTAAGFDVEDLDAEVAELREKGVTFEEYDLPGLKTEKGIAEIGGTRGAWFKDLDGNILAIGEFEE